LCVCYLCLSVQDKNWSSRFDLLVATPLRLLSVVRAGAIDLSKVQMVVLDEADKLLDLDAGGRRGEAEAAEEEEEEEEDVPPAKGKGRGKDSSSDSSKKKRKNHHRDGDSDEESSGDETEGEEEVGGGKAGMSERVRTSFLSQVDEILADCPAKGVQRALFSATVGPFVKELADGFLQNPVQITIGKENAGASTIDQKLMFVGREDGKLLALRQIVQEGLRPPVLLFMQSVDRAKVC
jgi:superfamily II DNA/RNA helicase